MHDYRRALPWSELQPARSPADLAPANLALFAEVHRYRFEDCPLPAISGRTYDGVRHLVPLFDLRVYNGIELTERLGGHDCYFPVPEEWLDRVDRSIFAVTHRNADSDYIYSAGGMRELAGRARRHRLSLATHFEYNHAPYACDLDSESAALAVLDGWLEDVGKPPGQTDWKQARMAIERRTELGLIGRVAFTNMCVPAGFVMASRLGDCAIVHFAKGRRAFDGVYPWLFRDFARQHADLAWLNFEQDLGIPGLRRNKLAFSPEYFVRKYRITPRSKRTV